MPPPRPPHIHSRGGHYVNIDIMKINPLHYVLLAGIDATPSSGYDLTLWLANLGRHLRAPEHSSISPARQQLDTPRLIAHREQLGPRGPPRKVYRPTKRRRVSLDHRDDDLSADPH